MNHTDRERISRLEAENAILRGNVAELDAITTALNTALGVVAREVGLSTPIDTTAEPGPKAAVH